MIPVTRLSGSVFVLNSDLIERVEGLPDTVITLVGGARYVVTETVDEIVELVMASRRQQSIDAFSPEPARRRPSRPMIRGVQ